MPFNFSSYSGACYYVSENKVSAAQAAAQCGAIKGGRLVLVADENDLDSFVTAQISVKDKWIGALNLEQGR